MALKRTLHITNSTFIDCRTGVRAKGDIDINVDSTRFERVKTVFDLDDKTPSPELVEPVFASLSALQQITGASPSATDAERAAERSGLKAWMIDKGVDIANLGVTLLGIWLGK